MAEVLSFSFLCSIFTRLFYLLYYFPLATLTSTLLMVIYENLIV